MFRHVSVVRKKKHWYANENGQQKEKEGTAQCMQMSGVMKAERKRSAHCGPDATAPCNRRRAKETAHLPVSYRAHLHIAVGPRLDALRPRARSSSCIRGDFPIRRLGPGMQMRWLRQSIPRTMTSQSNAGNLPECQPPPRHTHKRKRMTDGFDASTNHERAARSNTTTHRPTQPDRAAVIAEGANVGSTKGKKNAIINGASCHRSRGQSSSFVLELENRSVQIVA